MSKEKMSKKIIEGGYQPSTDSQKGYQPNGPKASIDNSNLPKGGSGQSGSGSEKLNTSKNS
jgi:hypothetical protein